MKKITQFLRNYQRRAVLCGSLMMFSAASSAADLTPTTVTNLFTNLGDTAAGLLTLAIVLFGAIRGGVAVIKISGKFFGAAGA